MAAASRVSFPARHPNVERVISAQTLQEYFVTAKLGVPVEIARRKVELFARFLQHGRKIDGLEIVKPFL